MQTFRFLDRERNLAYSFASIKRIREQYKDGHDFKLDEIPALICEGLKREYPDITPEQVEEIIDIETIDELFVALRKAMSFGKPAEKETTENPTTESSETTGPLLDTISDSPILSSGN